MSLESGKNLGLISSLIFVILPIIAIVALTGFIVSIISIAGSISSSTTIPSSLFGSLAGFGVTFLILGIIGFVGLIMFIVAMYTLSHYYNERGIFTGVIYAVILNFVTGIVVAVVEFAFLIPAISSLSSTSTPSTLFASSFFAVIIGLLVVSIVISIISAILIMRSFNRLAERSEVDSFKTAGLLYLIGVLLSIVFVGTIIIWIAFIFAAIGFSHLKPLPAPTTTPAYTSPPINVPSTKVCPNCGTQNNVEAIFCKNCGKPL